MTDLDSTPGGPVVRAVGGAGVVCPALEGEGKHTLVPRHRLALLASRLLDILDQGDLARRDEQQDDWVKHPARHALTTSLLQTADVTRRYEKISFISTFFWFLFLSPFLGPQQCEIISVCLIKLSILSYSIKVCARVSLRSAEDSETGGAFMVMKSELTTSHYVVHYVQLSSLLIFYPHLQDKALFIFTFDFKYNKAQFI